jgi:Flp pilus assembly protein TadG
MSRYRRLIRDRAGIASLEAALLVGLVLAPLVGGAADFGIILVGWAAATRAEHAGLFYAFANGVSITGMQDAALAAYAATSPAPTITAGETCYCLPTSTPWSRGNASAVACGSACGSGDQLTAFITLSVNATVALPMPLPGFGSSYQIATSATARLQ